MAGLPAQQLKAATAKAHSNIEGGFPVLREDFSQEKYKELLEKLYGFYLPLEIMFANEPGLGDWVQDYSERRKLELLKKDLEYFGVSDSELRSLAAKPLWFDQTTKPRILGTLYVLEGSTLGGQIISKHLKNKFHFRDEKGTCFFSAYGGNTGLMWKRFQALLNEHLSEISLLEESILAANSTFEHLGRWLKSSN